MARAYRTCPAQWGHMVNHTPVPPQDRRGNVAQRVGTVMHAALAAAYRTAQVRSRLHPDAYHVDRPMTQFWVAARTALGTAWTEQGLADEGAALANEVVALLRDVLDWLPTPRIGEIIAVERSYETATDGGLLVDWRPDLVLAVLDDQGYARGGRYVIIDWKLGNVDDVEVSRSDQLLPYAGLLALTAPLAVSAVRMELRSLRQRRINGAPADPTLAAISLAGLERTARLAESDTVLATVPGEHCSSCRFARVCPDSASPGPRDVVGAGEGR